MKTTDAFALCDFDETRILKRPFFYRIKDKRGTWLFRLYGADDEDILSSYQNKAQNFFDLDNFADAQRELDNLTHILENLKAYEKKLNHHYSRLEKYFQRLNQRVCSDETLSADVIRQKTRRINCLRERYLSACNATARLWKSIESFIAGLEEDYSLQYSRTFAVRLRQARKEARLTQAQLAAQIGMTQGGYTQYENAGREPSLSTLAKLSRILKRPTDWLLGLA